MNRSSANQYVELEQAVYSCAVSQVYNSPCYTYRQLHVPSFSGVAAYIAALYVPSSATCNAPLAGGQVRGSPIPWLAQRVAAIWATLTKRKNKRIAWHRFIAAFAAGTVR